MGTDPVAPATAGAAIDPDGASRRGWRPGSLLALAAVGVGALALGFLPDPNERIQWYGRYAVPVLWANLALVAGLSLRMLVARWRMGVRPEFRSGAIAAIAIAVLVGALALLVPARMRIQMDESQIAGTAYGVWRQQTPVLPASGIVDASGPRPYTLSVDKRGALLPVLLAMVQGSTRFELERAYTLELALGFLGLLAFYSLMRKWLRPEAALAGVLFLAANPTFAWCLRSIELEMLNLALLSLAGVVAVVALRDREPRAALLLAWLGPLLAQGRYESAIASVIGLGIATFVLARCETRRWELALFALVPAAYLPLAWQRAKPFVFGLEQVGSDHAFGLDHFWNNLVAALHFFIRPGTLDPLAPLQFALALLALVLAVAGRRARTAAGEPGRLELALLCAAVAGITVVVFTLAWGNLNSATVVRLGLPLMLLIAASAAAALDRLRARGWLPRGGVGLAAGLALLGSTPAIRSDAGYDDLLVGPAVNRVMEWSGVALPGCRPLYVSPYAQFFLTQDRSSVPPADLRKRWSLVQRAATAGVVDSVLVVQVGELETNRPLEHNTVPEGFQQRQLLVEQAGRVAAVRVVAIDDPRDPLRSRNANCRLVHLTDASTGSSR